MRTYTKLFEQKKLDIQSNTVNYLSIEELSKYLEIAKAFISEEGRYVIQWLIDNNAEYISELSNDTDENALAGFYNAGTPSNPSLKELYKNLGNVIKHGRKMEIPVFQTREQFDAIINQKMAPDMVILDLDSEQGRSEVFTKYQPLIHKICKQWLGKSNLSYDDLLSAAQEGLTRAMNSYGKHSKGTKATDDKIAGTTFGQYAAYLIRTWILEDIKNVSQTVRIPVSKQNKDRKETGHNVKNNSISGDKTVSNSDDEGNKTLFDFFGGSEDSSGSKLDKEDIDNVLQSIYKMMEEKFSKKEMDVWFSANGINGHEKLKNKEIAKKYNVVPSNINYYLSKINTYIQNTPKILSKLSDIYDIMKECLNEQDHKKDLGDPIHF